MAVVELVIPARHDYLALVRIVVSACADLEEGVGHGRLDDLRLAVSEACSNAFDAHDRAGIDAPVVVICELGHDRLTVTVRDQGGGFDPALDRPLPEPGDPERLGHERGLGLALMRILTDELRFWTGDGGTIVELGVRARDTR